MPTCLDWSSADLVLHLAEVQLFRGAIVRRRLHDLDPAEVAKPPRADDYGDLLSLLRSASGALIDTPGAAAPAVIDTTDVQVGEHSFHTSRAGDQSAETILWLHGSGPGATALSNWEQALGAFGDRYHCIAPDIIGFGDSTHPLMPPAGMRAFTELR